MIDNVDKEQVFHYLLELNPQDIEQLYPHLESELHTTRVSLLEIVGLRGSQSALPIVEEMAKHPNPDISASANLAARRLRGRDAGSEVQKSLRDPQLGSRYPKLGYPGSCKLILQNPSQAKFHQSGA